MGFNAKGQVMLTSSTQGDTNCVVALIFIGYHNLVHCSLLQRLAMEHTLQAYFNKQLNLITPGAFVLHTEYLWQFKITFTLLHGTGC